MPTPQPPTGGTTTDRNKFLALCAEFGLIPDPGPGNDVLFTVDVNADDRQRRKLTGYSHFLAEFRFTEAGEFIELGVWE